MHQLSENLINSFESNSPIMQVLGSCLNEYNIMLMDMIKTIARDFMVMSLLHKKSNESFPTCHKYDLVQMDS